MLNCAFKDDFVPTVPPAHRGVKALIVDDDQFDRARIRRMFRKSGIPFALNEVEGLDALDQVLDREDFDVVLLDYNLPEGDGIEALKRIKGHKRNSNAAAIMIAGDDQSDVAVNAMKQGCLDYLPKSQLSAGRLTSSILAAIEQMEFATKENKQPSESSTLKKLTRLKYSSEIQPEIAKIIREIRTLQASASHPDFNFPGDLDRIEKRCIELWSTLRRPIKFEFEANASAQDLNRTPAEQ